MHTFASLASMSHKIFHFTLLDTNGYNILGGSPNVEHSTFMPTLTVRLRGPNPAEQEVALLCSSFQDLNGTSLVRMLLN